MKKWLAAILAGFMICTMCACSGAKDSDAWKKKYQTFELDHLTVYVPKEYVMTDVAEAPDSWNLAKQSEKLVVMASLDSYELLEKYGLEIDNIEDFTNLATASVKDPSITYDKDRAEITYQNDDIGYYYVVGIYKTSAGYWSLNFVCTVEDRPAMEKDMADWLRLVEFN